MNEETQPEALHLADWLEDQFDPDHLMSDAAAEIRRLYTRVQKLENELIEESKRTAEYKLQAQQLSQQHSMQSKMRKELEVKLLTERIHT